MKKLLCISLLLALVSCGEDAPVKAEKTKAPKQETKKTGAEAQLDPLKTVVEKKQFPNGIQIQWFIKGTGDQVQDGHVYLINYKVTLEDGTIVDGNHLLQRSTLPFLVGFGLQTKGWDIAMPELRIGDFAEVYLPGNLARGKKGVPGLIPPNAPNRIFIRIVSEKQPTRIVKGTKVWLLEENKKHSDSLITATSEVAFHYFVGSKSNPKYDNSYEKGEPFVFGMDDRSIVPGLKNALIGAKDFDKLWVVVPADQAYGHQGIPDLVKPDEPMFYDLLIVSHRD